MQRNICNIHANFKQFFADSYNMMGDCTRSAAADTIAIILPRFMVKLIIVALSPGIDSLLQ